MLTEAALDPFVGMPLADEVLMGFIGWMEP